MSGIFGIVNFDGKPVSQLDLTQMRTTMAHRGPDSSNFYLMNDAGFGHLMLCSSKESCNEQLPWLDPLSGLLITADARLDNREELLAALSLRSRAKAPITDSRQPTTDSQLILAAFIKWGEACVEYLLGDFSFAIWDKQNRRLFVARDHMGLRPFYYYASDKCFIFASAANAIARASDAPNTINDARMADFLVSELEGINNTTTFFKHIYRMPPAHRGVIEKNKQVFQQYWQLNTDTCLQLNSDDDYADALEEALTLAIKARLRSHRPTASMLSGGADSSTISGIAAKISTQNGIGSYRTYSAVSDDMSNCCESSFINLMANHGGLDCRFLRPSDIKDYASGFDQIEPALEDPFDKSWSMLCLIYLAAREQGSVAVMDGMGGDLITGITQSYPSYLLRQGNFRQAFQEISRSRKNYFDGQISWLKAHTQAIRPAITPQALRQLKARFRASNWSHVELANSMLSKEFANKVKLKDRWKEYKHQSTLGFCPTLRHAHAERMVVPYHTAAIERYERLASYCGIETRQPFNDKRVVELCLSMPWQQHAQHGWMKYCLRNVLQRVAPREVAWRTSFDSIMWKFGHAWDAINHQKNTSTITDNREQLLNILDARQLDKMLRRYAQCEDNPEGNNEANPEDNSEENEDAMEAIGNVVTLHKWLQKNRAESQH